MALSQRSWITSANDPASDFSIANLPYGVFRHQEQTRIGVAIGAAFSICKPPRARVYW